MDEKDYWLGFSVFSGIGPLKFKKLLAVFGAAERAWKAKITDLEKVLGDKLTARFEKFRNEFDLSEYVKKLKEKDVWFLTLEDKNYPKLLSKITNPPFILYGKGESDFLNGKTIGVVGARRTTQYGRGVTKLLTSELVTAGFTIVSGLAIGIDAVSHMTALEDGGRTIAVLGCGVDCCTPVSNKNIYDKIINGGGCVISEVPLSYMPGKGLFPSRNRIIAGLSLALLVTEGAEDSGSLITADFAFKFNRKVFAVPGPITSSLSKGPYKLINQGAKLVISVEDILKELGIKNYDLRIGKAKQKIEGETKEEKLVLQVLENEKLYFDEIARKTGIDSSELGSILSMMEIKGIIKNFGGLYSVDN